MRRTEISFARARNASPSCTASSERSRRVGSFAAMTSTRGPSRRELEARFGQGQRVSLAGNGTYLGQRSSDSMLGAIRTSSSCKGAFSSLD